MSADNSREKLTLTFDAMLRFDLADAKATLPPMIESIDSETDHDAVLVRFNFSQRVDVRTFREDNSFVVDVEPTDRKTARQDGSVRSDELATLAAELAERANAAPICVGAQVGAGAQGRTRARAARRAGAAASATTIGEAAATARAAAQQPPVSSSRGARTAAGRRAIEAAGASPAGPAQTPPPQPRRRRRHRHRLRRRWQKPRRPASAPPPRRRKPPSRSRRSHRFARRRRRRQRHRAQRPCPRAAGGRRKRCRPRRAQAHRRQSQHHVPVRDADAGRDVPPRRYGVDGVRHRRPGGDLGAERGAGQGHPQRDVAARARHYAGARQARTAAAHQRGRRRTMPGWSRSATRWSSRRGRFRSAAISPGRRARASRSRSTKRAACIASRIPTSATCCT